jgi:alkaline phosphatase
MNKLRVLVCACLILCGTAVYNFASAADAIPKNIIILFADGTTGSQYEFGHYSSALLRQQSFTITDVVMSQG